MHIHGQAMLYNKVSSALALRTLEKDAQEGHEKHKPEVLLGNDVLPAEVPAPVVIIPQVTNDSKRPWTKYSQGVQKKY